MCLSRIGWPRRDGLTSCNRLSPRRIGGSSRFVDVVGSSFPRSLALRRAASSLTAYHTLEGCARALCTLFPWRGVEHPWRKRSPALGPLADTVRRTASGACVHRENYSSAGRIFTKDIVVSCHCEKRSRSGIIQISLR